MINRTEIKKIWLTEEAIYIENTAGECAKEEFRKYPRLWAATPKERQEYELSYFGIHWPALDEDLCYDGFYAQRRKGI